MAKTILFPANHPGGALLAPADKLIFELVTDSAAPIFSFKVDAALLYDATTAPHTITGNLNKYKWEHPSVPAKIGEIDFLDLAVVIVEDEYYEYKISKKSQGSRATLLLHMRFTGPEVVERDAFNMVVA